jgi:hypothetical protein
MEPQECQFVASRGGWPLLSHFRGAEERVHHRRVAIERAFARFVTAERSGEPEPEVGGLGLLVLQRALLAAEDLGALIHAMLGPDPWRRLRSAKLPDVKAAYELAATAPETVLADAFLLATNEQIDKEPNQQQEREALKQVRLLAASRWTDMLTRSAALWLGLHNVAKATQHGFPIVAGVVIDSPPGAGQLGRGVRAPARYALAVTSRISGTEVTTDRQIVRLARHDVEAYARNGKTAARLAQELCEIQAEGIVSGYLFSVPLRSGAFLSSDQRAALEGLHE